MHRCQDNRPRLQQITNTLAMSTQLGLMSKFGEYVCNAQNSKSTNAVLYLKFNLITKSITTWNGSVCLCNYLAYIQYLYKAVIFITQSHSSLQKFPFHFTFHDSIVFFCHNIYSIQRQIKVHQFLLRQSPTEFTRLSFHKFVNQFFDIYWLILIFTD